MLDKIIGSTLFKFFFFALSFAILFSKSDRRFGWTNAEAKMGEPIMSDGSGYYAHLPQWFTYHTSSFEFSGKISQKYPHSRFTDFTANDTATKKYYNKYYVGSAICLTPFYWAAQAHAGIAKVPNDGYSWPFTFWTNIGVIFFVILGGWALLRLTQFYKIKPWIAYLGIGCIFFGTNLHYFTTVEIPFSHGFGFAVNTWILVLAKKWADQNKRKHFYWSSALIGLTIVIRPTNLFVVFVIPFLFRSTTSFIERLKELVLVRRFQLLIGLLLAFAFIAFQLWNVWIDSGVVQFNSYTTEGFDNWKNPEIWNVLFSWKKGLFVYTPVLILLFPALIACYRRERRLLWGVLVVFALVTYSTAAWWTWTFGGGLGARNYIDFMSLFFLPVMILIQYSHWSLKIIFCSFAILASRVYLVYDYQMRSAILHYDKMDYTSYWELFQKTDARFSWYMDRNFQKKPKRIEHRNREMYFTDSKKQAIKAQILRTDKNNLWDDPILNYNLQKDHSSSIKGRFGVKISTDVLVYEHFNNPSVGIYLFKKDSLIEETSLQFGAKIPELKEWAHVNLFFNMDRKWNDVDSIEVRMADGLGNMAVRNVKAQFYSYK